MKARLIKIAKWLAYPAFYLFCLFLFGYLTFPYDRLKHRLIAEFDQMQSKRGGQAQKLEIDELDSYWLTGVELKGARLILPPEGGGVGGVSKMNIGAVLGTKDAKDAKDEGPKPAVIEIDEAHARVKILPLLIGRVRVNFWASVFGGEVQGTAPVGKSGGTVEVEMKDLDMAKVQPLQELIEGVPIRGILSGRLELEAPEGKFNKANGSLEVTATDVAVLDAKKKIMGLVSLPAAKLGELSLSAEAKDGVLKVTKLSCTGPDIELEGDGKVNVREPWQSSAADLYLRFKFADGYRSKTDETKSVLGDPSGSGPPPLMETMVPKMKRAKRSDGAFGWHVHGALKKLRYDPHSTDGAAAGAKRGKGNDSPFAGAKKPALNLPSSVPERVSEPKKVEEPEKKEEKVEEKVEEKREEPPPPPPPPPEEKAEPPPRSPARGEETDERTMPDGE